MVNTYAVQSGGCRFESLWGFGFILKSANYEVDYCGKKTFLARLQCTLTSSCAKRRTWKSMLLALRDLAGGLIMPLGTPVDFLGVLSLLTTGITHTLKYPKVQPSLLTMYHMVQSFGTVNQRFSGHVG